MSGAFAAGFLFTVIGRPFSVPMWVQSAPFVGFLGGYTTFSALSLDTYALIERGRFSVAGAYAVGSIMGGVVAVFAGVVAARAVA